MTQEEKVQELMKPRVKVIAPWPEMERWLVRVGDILTDLGGNETVRNQNGDAVPAFEWETYPHLFRKLEWHEEREASEMPEYYKYSGTHGIYKTQFQPNGGIIMLDFKPTETVACKLSDCLPATPSDYHAYINQPA